MDFSGASLNLKANGASELFALLDKIDKRGQEVADRLTKSLSNALGGAGGNGNGAGAGRGLRAEAEETEKSLLHMSLSSAIGLGELGRAFARLAQSGQMGAFAMREFTGAAMRLAPG